MSAVVHLRNQTAVNGPWLTPPPSPATRANERASIPSSPPVHTSHTLILCFYFGAKEGWYSSWLRFGDRERRAPCENRRYCLKSDDRACVYRCRRVFRRAQRRALLRFLAGESRSPWSQTNTIARKCRRTKNGLRTALVCQFERRPGRLKPSNLARLLPSGGILSMATP